MVSPAQPAQPIKPELPNTGGYTGPTQRTPRTVPLPSGQPAGPPPPPSPSPQAAPGISSPGAPPVSQALGIGPQEYQGIVEQMEESPEQQTFQKQFQTLAEQRALLGGPASIDERGYHQPDEKFEDYMQKFVKAGIAHLSAPEMVGGKGKTLAEARMMAIAEARRRWPQYDPSMFARFATPSGILPKSPSIDPDKGGPAPEMEFGPTRAAKLDLPKVAEILNYKRFKHAIDWAKEYKDSAGSAANATEFADYIIQKRISKNMEGLNKFTEAKSAVEAQVAELQAQRQLADAQGQDTAELDTALAQAKLQAAQMKKQALQVPSAQDVASDAQKYFTDNIETFSVAAAFSQLY